MGLHNLVWHLPGPVLPPKGAAVSWVYIGSEVETFVAFHNFVASYSVYIVYGILLGVTGGIILCQIYSPALIWDDVILQYIYHHYKMTFVCLSVRPLWKVSGNDLTSSQVMLYL